MIPKIKFSASPVITISVEGLLPERVFMIDTGAEPNFIKARNVHPDTQILREDKLHIVDVTDGFVESLGSIQVSLMGHPLRMDVVPDNFPIQEGILRTDFLKDSATTLIQYDAQGSIMWHGIIIPCTRQDAVLIPARTAKVFYVKIKNPEIKAGLIPRLHLGDGLYASNALVKNHGGRAYIEIINTRDTDERIIAPEVELEELDNIATSRPGKPSPRDRNVRMHAVNAITTNDDRSTRNRSLRKLLRLDHLNEEEIIHVDKIISKHSDLFQLPDEPLGHTDIAAHKIVTIDDRTINTKQYRFPPFHKEEINKQVEDLMKNDVIKPSNSPYNSLIWVVPKKPDSQRNKRWRMMIDFRALNEKTIGDTYPLPNITEILDQLAQIF